jgi:hypothetical protein
LTAGLHVSIFFCRNRINYYFSTIEDSITMRSRDSIKQNIFLVGDFPSSFCFFCVYLHLKKKLAQPQSNKQSKPIEKPPPT